MILLSLSVAIGGALGALSRYFISTRFNGNFPWGTVLVNILGSFLLGWYVVDKSQELMSSFYGTGFLGALTTFSTLQFEAVTIYKKNKKKVILYLFITYTLGLTAVWTGYQFGKL